MRKISALLCLVASSLLVLTHAYENPVFTTLHFSLKDDNKVTARQIFRKCDLDKDQKITREEYVKCTHNYEGWDALERFDQNRDRALQYKEVREAVRDQERRVRQEFSMMSDEDTEAVKQAFKAADVDQDGLLTREEFSDFFEQSGQPVS